MASSSTLFYVRKLFPPRLPLSLTVVRPQDQRLPEAVERRLEFRAEHVDVVGPLFFFFFFREVGVEKRGE